MLIIDVIINQNRAGMATSVLDKIEFIELCWWLRLLEECLWIEACGFNTQMILSKQLLSEENKGDIALMLECLTEGRNEIQQSDIQNVLLRLGNLIR